MELRHLRYFVTVAEESSFSRAAQRLRVSQPPLSRQIRDLEAEMGVKLFVRDKRGVRLTDAGALFLRESRQILEASRRAVHLAQAAHRGEIARLKVAYSAALFVPELARGMRAFQRQYPLVELEVSEMTSQQQIQELLEKRLDAGYSSARFPAFEKELVFECVRRETPCVALPPGHPLTRQRQVEMRDLAMERFVTPPRNNPLFENFLMRLCRSAGFLPRAVQETESGFNILALVSAGVGVALVSESLKSLRSVEVEFRSLKPAPPLLEFYIVRRADSPSVALRAFIQVLARHLGRARRPKRAR
jgi:DNA-binding transcriptional LysR family regulator